MRTRAGIVLIENGNLALIERHRDGLDYFVFPGGGVDPGETIEQAAVRETLEELGVEVVIERTVAEIRLGPRSRQVYFLVRSTGGQFGMGTGEEYLHSDPNDPYEGSYEAVWMPVDQLALHRNIYPSELAQLVAHALQTGWPPEPVAFDESF